MRMKKALSLILSVIMVIGIIPVMSFAEIDVDAGLIAYYNFEEDAANPSTIKDASGNGNDATVLNTVSTSGWNRVNNVLTVSDGIAAFPGFTNNRGTSKGAAMKLPNDFNQKADSFTFSAWIKADGNNTYAIKMTRIFDFANMGSAATDKTNSIFARYTSSDGNMRIQDRTASSSTTYCETTLSEKPFTDAWGLFTLVYEKNEETGYYETAVYINGEIVPALSTTNLFTRGLSALGELDDTSNGMFIGRTTWGQVDTSADNPDFKGQMDEIRIYNRALTADEIGYLYENTNPLGEHKMTSYVVETVTTLAGDYPILPESVKVTYNTGAVKNESVTWDLIPSEKYGDEGTITVNGITEAGNAVTVNVVVIKKSESTLSHGLLAYYSFDSDAAEPTTIVDVSGNGNSATVYNTYEEVSTRGPWGSSTVTIDQKATVKDGVLYFPGSVLGSDVGLGGWESSYYYNGAAIRMPDDIGADVEEFTYSAWIYADTDYRYSGNIQRFFDFGVAQRDSVFYRYVPTTGESMFQVRGVADSSSDPASLMEATLEDNPFKDNWAHLVVTYEKSSAGEYYTPTIYINGVERYEYDNSLTTLTRTLSDMGAASAGDYGYWIGRTQWYADSSSQQTNPEFKGKMDEIRLYDRVLTHSEINELYNGHKPSDIPVDYESMPQTKIAVDEDVELSGKFPDMNMNGINGITGAEGGVEFLVSSNNGAAYTRYALVRASEMTTGEITALANCEKAVLSLNVGLVDNNGTNNFYCYGLTGDNNNWNVDTVTMNNYSSEIGGTITNVGVSDVGELLDTQTATGQSTEFYMQFDVTDFVRENAAKGFSFLLTCGSNVAYIRSSENEDADKKPSLIVYQLGTPITLNRVDTEGNEISTATVYGVMGESYTYNVADALVSYNNSIYAVNKELSSLTVDEVTGEDTITVVYEKAENITHDEVSVRTYVGKAPSLPRVLTVTNGEYSAAFAVQWDAIDSSLYAQTGTFEATGNILGTEEKISGTVTVFPEYNGAVGGDLTITVYIDGEENETFRVEGAYGSVFTLSESYETYLGTLYNFDRVEGVITKIGDSVIMNELNQHIDLYYMMKEEIEGTLSVKIKADDFAETSYTLTASASVLNTEKSDKTVKLVIADYNDNGELTNAVTESVLAESRTGETVPITKKVAFDKEKMANSVVYLWTDTMEPLAESVKVADVKVEGYMGAEVEAMIPTYDRAVAAIESANNYWQNNYSYNTQTSGIDIAFWSRAAYHTGNMEVYRLLEDENYLKYSIDWANDNEWMGNNNTWTDKDSWTWGYNQNQGSDAVLFGDWQICFQSYLDMAEFGVEDANLDRVFEVMDYQISKDEDAFWWWADALYMVMPVMTKLYKNTGDEKYLDALYKYFKYAKELMYDGPGGIPTSEDGYTTSARLSSGAYYSDPDNYAYLFFRDAGYVYPLNPNAGHESEKNFWARGDGWVFAGLAKVLNDMPETYEHYDEFYNTYMEMAPAIIACQQTDESGYGFWTQSMLQNYPVGNNGNNEGYETSGTAFFTYGLFWGINNGLLDEETYLEPTLRAWGYLENVALLSNGKVGYVQPIGSNATAATPQSTTQDFGVGAFLLASCEAARWAENQ